MCKMTMYLPIYTMGSKIFEVESKFQKEVVRTHYLPKFGVHYYLENFK